MATIRIDYPGIGGSLGECVVCGKTFVGECLLGTSASTIKIAGIERALPVHTKCGDLVMEIKDSDWRKLPEGPLRTLFQETDEEMRAGDAKEI